MGDRLVLHVGRLIRHVDVQSGSVPVEVVSPDSHRGSSDVGVEEASCVIAPVADGDNSVEETEGSDGEDAPLIQGAECRICQEEDIIKNLETPCACSGSLKYAHRKCVQHWCDEKGDITCEICHQSYQPGYTAPLRPPPSEETTIDIGWTISGNPLDLHDPRLLAIAEAERHYLEAEYDEYNGASNSSGAAFFRSIALILMALLLLRHAMTITDPDADDDDASAAFSIFLLRVVGFLLPCYIMAWAISIMQRKRQQQEVAAMAAMRAAVLLRYEQNRGAHVTAAASGAGPGAAPAAAAPSQEELV